MFDLGSLMITSFQVKYLMLVAGLYLIHVAEYLIRKNEKKIAGNNPDTCTGTPLRAFGYTVMVLALLVIAQTEQSTFIYFQF